MVAVVPRTGVEMNMIFSKVRVERNVQRFQEKRKNGMNAKFSAKCVALIAAGAMSMSLAACSGGSMDDSSSSNGSAANSDTITLGSVTTNSGTAAAYGEAEVAGFKLAVDEINAKGGINGKKVKLESMDDKGDATEASNAFNKLAGDNSVLGVVIMVALQLFVTYTKQGKAMRAVSEDKEASILMGINVNSTITLTFAIGSGLAAVASLMYCVSYPQVSPMMGAMLGLKAFVAAVLGGIGSIPGAMVGGLVIGVVESLTKAYIGTITGGVITSAFSDAIVFGILIIVLLVKPSGLMGEPETEKV